MRGGWRSAARLPSRGGALKPEPGVHRRNLAHLQFAAAARKPGVGRERPPELGKAPDRRLGPLTSVATVQPLRSGHQQRECAPSRCPLPPPPAWRPQRPCKPGGAFRPAQLACQPTPGMRESGPSRSPAHGGRLHRTRPARRQHSAAFDRKLSLGAGLIQLGDWADPRPSIVQPYLVFHEVGWRCNRLAGWHAGLPSAPDF